MIKEHKSMRRKKKTTVWAYLDGKKLVDVVQAALDITPELEHRKSGYVERKRRPYQGNVVRIA